MPDYRLPVLGLLRFSLPFLLARRRSFSRDGLRVMAANPYPRHFEGLENVPREGPFILVMNHYNRPGLRPQIVAFLISAAVAQLRPGQPEIRWVFAGELERFIYAPIPMPRWLMRWLFRRLALVYGLHTMPREWRSPLERAAAVRRILEAAHTAPVGLTPEAGGPGILREPPPGTGLFLSALARTGHPFLPVAAFEEADGTLVIRFGPPFHLDLPREGSKATQDRRAIERVMTAIARLLPERFRGAYGEQAAREGAEP